MADNIPDVDLSGVKEQLESEATKPDLGQFKSETDLLKGYKEIQAAFTRVSQENKALKEQGGNPERVAQLEQELASMREEAELLRLQSQTPANTQQSPRSFDESWMESPEATIDQRVNEKLIQARIQDALDAEESKNRVEYPERYKMADALATRYPQLAKTPKGVHKLFEMADEMRKHQMKETSKKTLEYLLGENPSEEQLAKFKELLTGNKKTVLCLQPTFPMEAPAPQLPLMETAASSSCGAARGARAATPRLAPSRPSATRFRSRGRRSRPRRSAPSSR